MSCGCGKKKCNGKCGISPSVLQINNNDCTLFHKVEVPAVMGDETTNPPKTGAYRNVLLYYEASGNSYLYSSDGIPTKLTGVVSDYEVLTNKPSINGVVLIKNKTLADLGIISAIDSAVAAEATARENADNALSDRITTNANNIAANATAISNEVTARTNADNTLSARISGNTTAINNEKTARENADTALSNRITTNTNAISAETTARENADSALSDRITTNANNIAANTTAISNEATARENADTALGNRITANTTAIGGEATARENADNALSGRITTNATAISNEKTARENADTALSNRITANANAISAETTARENADTALGGRIDTVAATAGSAVQPNDINYDVLTDIDVSANSSTSIVELEGSIVNLKTGLTSSEQIALPVASSTEAGVMNSSTFDAVTANTNNINAIMNGAVAITGLSANPSQSDLTTAWENETGLSSLINRASVYDVTNNKVWTYYTNDTTWHAASNTSSVTVNTFTNSSEGTIKGSTNIGQVFAENDGTGSVNGWDALSSDVANAKSKLSGIQSGAEVNVQSDWNVSDNTSDAYIKNKPTIGNATLTIQKNGTAVDTFTANATSNKTVNITVPVKTSDVTNDGSDGTSTYVEADDLATVATSGSYNDLSNKPTIGNATLTIQKNGSTVDTFTANATSNKTVNITVPTKTSDITNDSGYITSSALPTVNNGTLTIKKNNTNVATFTANQSGNSTANIEVPTKTSELDNDAGFIANDTHQVCGEGGDITLNTTTFEPLEMNHLGGNTEQQTYSGKNLLNFSAPRDTNSGTDYSFDASSGVLTVTKSSATAANRYSGWYVTGLTAGAKYTFSIESFTNSALSNADRAMMIRSYNGTSASEIISLNKTQTSYTITIPNGSVRLEFFFYIASGNTNSTSTVKKPMLEAGETATAYEPYVGGTASPNPDYPQAVQTVTGENVVKICGKNLFDKSTQVKGYLDTNGVVINTSSASDCTSVFIKAEPNTAYTLSSPGWWLKIAQYDSSQNFIRIDQSGANISAKTITTQSNTAYIRISYGNAQNSPDVQLEKGSTATAYEPYQGQSYEVNLGKNLFDKGNANISHFYPSTSTMAQNASAVAIVLPVEAGQTYTASTTNRALLDSTPALAYTNKIITQASEPFLSRTGWGSGNSVSATAPSGAKYMYLYVKWSQNAEVIANVLATLQIEKGSQATSYAAYFTPIELCKIGTYQDSIYKSGGKWYVRKECGVAHLPNDLASVGSNNTGTAGVRRFGIGITNSSNVFRTSGSTTTYPIFCSMLPAGNRGQTNDKREVIGYGIDGTGAYRDFSVYIAACNAMTNEQFESWLNSNPLDIAYLLATPTDTEITNEALVAQLEALWEADGYDSQTNITLTYAKGNAQGILSVCQYPSHLPVATKSKLGTIIVGHGLDIEDDGRLDVIVDNALSDSSIHPVQNSVITTELNSKADISSVPTKTSQLENDSGFVVNDTTEICDEGSDITLNGTLLEPLDVKKIEGETSQQTYTGKNLLPNNLQTRTLNGVTFTRNNDGSIKISGTATERAEPMLWAVSQGGSLVFTAGKTYKNTTSVVLYFHASGYFKIGAGATYSPTANQNCDQAYIRIENGETIDTTIFPQIIESGVDESYEPYVGGTASPNPDYPQAVQTVTGENVVKITGKNLFNLATPATNNGVTVTANADGSFTLNGTTTGVAVFNFILPVLKPAGTYTISCTSKNQVMPNSFYIRARNQNMTMLVPGGADGPSQIRGGGTNYAEKTFTSTDPMYCLALNLTTTGVTYNNMIIYPQVEVGSAATAFEPYQGQSYPIDLGGTIELDMSQATRLDAYINGSGVIVSSDANALFGIAVEPNTTYTITKIASSRFRYVCTSTTPAIGATVGTTTNNDSATSVTVTTGANDTYLVCTYWSNTSASTKDDVFNSVKITTGGSGIELCKLGDYQDYIYKSGDKWYVRKEVGKAVFDGTKNWFKSGTSTSSVFAGALDVSSLGVKAGTAKFALSDSFDYNFDDKSAITAGTFAFYNGTTTYNHIRLCLSTSTAADIDALKAWLAAHPTVVYYVLATPTDTEITNETLVAQLEALWRADGYDGQTHITALYADGNAQMQLAVCQYPSHLPIATTSQLGAVIVGDGLQIEPDGRLDVIVDDELSTTSRNPVQNAVVTEALAGKADNTDLSTVAMTGSYDDLTGKPTIPTVNNATLTIQKNGTNVATFTANSSTNVTANITAPVVTMTTTDPGEGGALAANNFIGVYV